MTAESTQDKWEDLGLDSDRLNHRDQASVQGEKRCDLSD